MKVKEFITKERAQEIKQEIASLERQINGGDDNRRDGVGFMSHAVNQVQNPEDIQREINKKKLHLQEGLPKPFKSTVQANKAYQWAKKAERWIKQHHPDNVFVTYPKPGAQEHDFDRSVKQMTDWLQKGDKVYSTYRYIMRRLEPANPDAGNIRGL